MAGWIVQLTGGVMQRILSVLFVLTLAVALFAPLAAGQQAPKAKTIELTIVATGKDEAPVQDLKQDDITIKDDNKKQEITSFEKLVGGAPAEPGKPAINNLVLIDSLETPFFDAPENRLAILKVLNELTKADNVTILMLRQDMKVASDPAQGANSLLGRFAKQGFDPSKPEAFNWVFADDSPLGQIFTPVLISSARARMEAWLHCLQIIAQNMQARPGRRNLFWFSQYFPPLVFGETGAGYIEAVAGTNNQQQSGAQTSKSGKATSTDTTRNEEATLLSSYAKDIQTTARMLQGANVSIYPLDARYLCRNSTTTPDKSRMQDMAKSTGGLSFASPKDLSEAVRDAVKDTKTLYVARYVMADSMFNGRDHVIKVESKRKDVKLRVRDGYFAPKATN
jgi:VWFA-related protein